MVHGVVRGLATGGSALTVLLEPTCGVEGASTTCASSAPLDRNNKPPAIEPNSFRRRLIGAMLDIFVMAASSSFSL